MDHVQLLNLLNFWLLKICLCSNLGRCAWSFFAELLGDKLALGIVGYDILKLLDLGLQGHVSSLQILNILVLSFHRQDLIVELVRGLVGATIFLIDSM